MKIKHYTFLVSVTLITAFASCKLSSSDTPPPATAFYIVHASPNAPNVDIIANGGIYAQNLAYTKDTGYFYVPPALYNLKVASTGTTNYLIDANLTFQSGKFYSLFTIDSLSKIKAVVVEDVLAVPGTDSALIRFFQFSPNTPYAYAEFKNTTDSLKYSTGRTFNDQSTNSSFASFTPIKAGTYELKISPLDGSAVISFPGLVFANGRNYTIYLRGFKDGAGTQALGVGVIKNLGD